ncbi:MAG: diguanylate cyclase [Gemmatimonadaceae bacterium]|nr:diguanylate cyclase [Gemmatimonadaceae bacterium]
MNSVVIEAGATQVSDGETRTARRALWTMLHQACIAAALAHFVFLLLFAYMGLTLLVWANIGGVVLFICSGLLLLRRRNAVAMALVVGEILLHASLASALLGWESGFHYYLLTLAGPLVVGAGGTTMNKLARLLALGVAYAALDAWTRQVQPVYRLDPGMLASIRYLNIAGMLAIIGFVSLTYARLMASAEGALQTLARTDALTGLHNRRHLLEIVRTTRSAGADGPGLYVLLCDVDHFKKVNDTNGHEMGDLVLQRVADAVTTTVRTTDSVARWGGEEFIVLLPGAGRVGAMQMAERIRGAVAALSLHGHLLHADARQAGGSLASIRLTITIGVARVEPAETIDAAIARADAALYRGKAAGRNRVVDAGDAAIPSFAQAV